MSIINCIPHDVHCDGNTPYRLGDAILHSNGAVQQILYPDSPYQQSIAWKFITYTIKNKKIFDWKYLTKLAEQIEHTRFADDTIVLGLRLGDFKRVTDTPSLDHIVYNVNSMANDLNIHNITIVTALVWDPVNPLLDRDINTDINIRALNYIVNRLKSSGLTVNISSHKNADIDFASLATAQNLVVGTGNFNILAGICNKNNIRYSFTNKIILTEKTGNIKKRITATLQRIIEYYRSKSDIDISELDLTSIGPGSSMNKKLQCIMSNLT